MYYVGVDLGATNVRAAVGDGTASVVGRADGRTPDGPTGAAVTDAVVRVVREACADAGVAVESIAGASVGAMGRLDLELGGIRIPSNLSNDVGPIRLVDPIATLLDLRRSRISLHGDTAAGVVGERFHSYPDTEDVVYLTISSGIGAGVVTGGDLLTGWHGNAGEVGHTTIDATGLMTCGCGRAGHWEAYCSGNNVPRFARALATEREGEGGRVDTALPLDDPDFGAKHVFEGAASDDFAARVVDRVADLNTLGVANLAHSYAPQVVSVGGAVALNNPERVVGAIRERLDDAVLVDVPSVHVSDLGDDAVLLGALASAVGERDGED